MFSQKFSATFAMIGLVAASNAGFLEVQTPAAGITYNQNLGCTPCIVGGFGYCTNNGTA